LTSKALSEYIITEKHKETFTDIETSPSNYEYDPLVSKTG